MAFFLITLIILFYIYIYFDNSPRTLSSGSRTAYNPKSNSSQSGTTTSTNGKASNNSSTSSAVNSPRNNSTAEFFNEGERKFPLTLEQAFRNSKRPVQDKSKSELIVREFTASLSNECATVFGLKRESTLPYHKEIIRHHIIEHLLDVLIDSNCEVNYYSQLIGLEAYLLWYVDDDWFNRAVELEKKVKAEQSLNTEDNSFFNQVVEIALMVADPYWKHKEHIDKRIKPYGFSIQAIYQSKV